MITKFLTLLATALPALAQSPETVKSQVDPSLSTTETLKAFSLNEKAKYNPVDEGQEGDTHPGYVDPKAPKGGSLRMAGFRPPATLNPFLVRFMGPMGAEAALFGSLMKPSKDDPYSVYPSIAKSMTIDRDATFVIYNLDEKARFNDPENDGCKRKEGEPDKRQAITADDIAFSFDSLKSPLTHFGARGILSGVDGYDILDNGKRIKFRLKGPNTKSAAFELSKMPIFSKKFFDDKKLKFEDVGLHNRYPTSGPYIIDKADRNEVSYKRVCDFWAKDKFSYKGQNNFDRVEYQFYQNTDVTHSAFQREMIDLKFEEKATRWPSDLDNLSKGNHMYGAMAETVKAGKIGLHQVTFKGTSFVQGIAMNANKPALKDARVRKAIALMYDPEYVADSLKNGVAKPFVSYFSNLPKDKISQDEVQKILEELSKKYGDKFPKDALANATSQTRNNESTHDLRRKRNEEALNLMKAAGWQRVPDSTAPSGQSFVKGTSQFPELEWPVFTTTGDTLYRDRLQSFGFKVNMKEGADFVEVTRRQREGRFDMITYFTRHANVPGAELPASWSQAAADSPFGNNITKTRSPPLDELMRLIGSAPNESKRNEYIAAFDRVLQAETPIIPTTQENGFRFAVRNKFNRKFDLKRSGELEVSDIAIEAWWDKSLEKK